MNQVEIHIRRAQSLDDYQACLELQKEVWEFGRTDEAAAIPLLVVSNRHGGSVLIAEEPSGQSVGFSYALLCRRDDGSVFWWSHMTALARDWRGRRLGLRLKAAQRGEALSQNIREIWWTFDPLQAMNAHFNFRKLGVVSNRYEPNMYGPSSSPLHRGLPTDRLLVEWRLESARVMDRLSGRPPVILRDLDSLVRVFPVRDGRPRSLNRELDDRVLAFEIPLDFSVVREADHSSALEWQEAVREACVHYFARGYVLSDFVRVDRPHSHGLYVLEKEEGVDRSAVP